MQKAGQDGLLQGAKGLIQVNIHRADAGNHDSAAVATQGVAQDIGEHMVTVGGLVAFHQRVNDPPQHQQAAVDAGGLPLLLALST